MEWKCCSCGEPTEVCYTDEGVLGMTHGACQCRKCYTKDHPECPKCKGLTSPNWEFCAHCGVKLCKNKNTQRG